MPLFLPDEEYGRCSGDAFLISQMADAFIKELYNQLETQKAQHSQSLADLERKYNDKCDTLKRKDEVIKELESKLEALHNELCSSKDIVATTEEQLYKPQINRATSARIQFEPGVIKIVQNEVLFNGLPDEDPNGHIAHFLQICDVLERNGASDDAIRVHLFPFSLRDKAKLWVRSLPAGSITTWDTMAEKFLSKYFPRDRAANLRKEIVRFSQMDGESLYECWESFKDLLRRCPTHRMPLWDQVYTFYHGLYFQEMQTLDRAAGGSLMSKTPEEAFDLIERMAMCDYQWPDVRTQPSKQSVHEVDEKTDLTAKLEALTRKIDQMQVSCELCRGPHPSRDCHQGNMLASREEVSYVRNEVCNNTYDSGRRNHPNSCWQTNTFREYQQY